MGSGRVRAKGVVWLRQGEYGYAKGLFPKVPAKKSLGKKIKESG